MSFNVENDIENIVKWDLKSAGLYIIFVSTFSITFIYNLFRDMHFLGKPASAPTLSRNEEKGKQGEFCQMYISIVSVCKYGASVSLLSMHINDFYVRGMAVRNFGFFFLHVLVLFPSFLPGIKYMGKNCNLSVSFRNFSVNVFPFGAEFSVFYSIFPDCFFYQRLAMIECCDPAAEPTFARFWKNVPLCPNTITAKTFHISS